MYICIYSKLELVDSCRRMRLYLGRNRVPMVLLYGGMYVYIDNHTCIMHVCVYISAAFDLYPRVSMCELFHGKNHARRGKVRI